MEDNLSNGEGTVVPPPSAVVNDVDAEESCTNAETVDSFLSEAESRKDRGNIEFQKGRVLAKHTAGKTILCDACVLYAEGIQALGKADSLLAQLVHQQEELPVNTSPAFSEISQETGVTTTGTQTTLAALSKRAGTIRPSLYLNLAACNLIFEEWPAAVACCTFVLEQCGEEILAVVTTSSTDNKNADSSVPVRDPEQNGLQGAETEHPRENDASQSRKIATKALYRRSAAHMGSGDLVAAREDLIRGLRVKPGDVSFRRELKKVEKKLADIETRESLRRETEEGKRRRQDQQQQQRQEQGQRKACPDSNNDSAIDSRAPAKQPPSQTTLPTTTTADEDATKRENSRGGIQSIAPQPDRNIVCTNLSSPAPGFNGGRHPGKEGELSDGKARRQQGEGSGEEEEPFPTLNGGECREGLYAWNQSVLEVQVCVKVPSWVCAKDLRVEFHRLRLSVKTKVSPSDDDLNEAEDDDANTLRETPVGAVAPPSRARRDGEKAILVGALSRPVQVDECLWTMERPGSVVLYIQKELLAGEEPGSEWWAAVMEGDPKIDVLTCDAGSKASEYPEHARRRGAKALWEHQQKSPEERRKQKAQEQRLLDARRKMEEEAGERQRDLEKALQNPKKAELYRQLRKAMPDTPISIK